MKNRKLLLIVSLVLALTMSLGGTLAYLTDTDEAVNVMTLGNVKIEQLELQRKAGVDYENSGNIADGDELEPFKQGQPLYPAYTDDITDYTAKSLDDEQFWWGSYVTDDVTGKGSSNGLWDDDLVGAIDKFVFVENKGTSDCYYRTIIAFECPEGVEYSEGYDKQFMMNVNQNSRFTWEEVGYIKIEGVRYLLMVATYNQPLKAGKISRPSLLQVVMTHNATNEDVLKMGDTYEILVLSQAMQTKNFESLSAGDALNVAFGPVTLEKAQEWFAGVYERGGLPTTTVSTAAELKDAMAEGGIVVLGADIDLGAEQLTVAAGQDITIMLAGHDITGAYAGADHYAMFTIANGASLTIEGEGEVTTTTQANENNRSLSLFLNAGKLTLNGGTYKLTDSTEGKTWIIATLVDNRTNSAACETVLTINGGEYTVAGKAKNLFRNYPQQGGTATIVFNDGKFNANDGAETTYIWNQESRDYLGELYFNGGVYADKLVYEDYNGQSDIHIVEGVNIKACEDNT